MNIEYNATFGDFMTLNRTFQIVREDFKKKLVLYIFLCLGGFVIGLNIYFNFTFR